MGMINIIVEGSFKPNDEESFCAEDGGHAQAVANAIKYLAEVTMPMAIRQDHDLQTEGHAPVAGWGRKRQ